MFKHMFLLIIAVLCTAISSSAMIPTIVASPDNLAAISQFATIGTEVFRFSISSHPDRLVPAVFKDLVLKGLVSCPVVTVNALADSGLRDFAQWVLAFKDENRSYLEETKIAPEHLGDFKLITEGFKLPDPSNYEELVMICDEWALPTVPADSFTVPSFVGLPIK